MRESQVNGCGAISCRGDSAEFAFIFFHYQAKTLEWRNENPRESLGRPEKGLASELNKHRPGTSGPLRRTGNTHKSKQNHYLALLETGHSLITCVTRSINDHMVIAICKELRGRTFIVGDDTLFAVAYSALPQFCLLDKQHLCQDNKLAICWIFDSGQSLAWLKKQ